MMLEPVKLSLSTFQPNKCYAPYLNTPRSLEACRLNGINPVELVEIPFNEFQKDFPNNTDAVQRRYERINGARLRVYEQVMRDWKRLCDSKWKPATSRPQSAKETIVVVSPEAHCKLLEIQAEKFRKIEEHNWQALQRSLKLELMRADNDVKHKEIVEKHANIEKANNDLAEQRKNERDELYRQQLLRQQQEEIEEMKEIKRAQEFFQAQIIKRSQDEVENRRREKLFREQKESERVQSEKYTHAVRASILADMESKAENRKKTSEIRAKSEEQRIKEYFNERSKERDIRKNDVDSKIKQAQAEKQRLADEEREATLSKIQSMEKHREEVAAQREKTTKANMTTSNNDDKEKLNKIKESKENLTKEKCERTAQLLKHKEDLARQEREKIKDAQQQRRTIKAIRQEAHEIALFRTQKAEEYRREKLLHQLKEKEARANAIKQGFETLGQMRNSMKDIMTKTNLGMRAELNNLRHKDIFSPDKVVSKALEVSNRVLFPSLERKFGIKDPNEEDPVQKLFRTTSDEGFTFDVGGSNKAFLTTNEDDNEPLFEGDRTMKNTQSKPAAMKSKKLEKAPLPIQQLTQNNFKNALLESMRKVEDLNNVDHFGGTTTSPAHSHSPNASSRRPGRTAQHGTTNNDTDNFPTPILHLAEEDTMSDSKGGRSRSVRSAPNSLASSQIASKNSLSRSDGFQLGKHTNTAGDNHLLDKSRKAHKDRPQRDDDPKLPMYPFTAGAEFTEKPTEEERPQANTSSKKSSSQKYVKVRKEIRTDVNEKAKFLDPPAGKFRREFSNDHPLAAGGKGKYNKELNQGLKPTGLNVAVPQSKAIDVAETIALSNKVEKLTYEATTKVVDPSQSIDALTKDLKEQLQELIEDERLAEEDRFETISKLKDEAEKARLEKIFAEERQRASERIMKTTRQHDEMIKKAMLRSMNLG